MDFYSYILYLVPPYLTSVLVCSEADFLAVENSSKNMNSFILYRVIHKRGNSVLE